MKLAYLYYLSYTHSFSAEDFQLGKESQNQMHIQMSEKQRHVKTLPLFTYRPYLRIKGNVNVT